MTTKRGFTLLEVLIAMAILAFVSLFTAESIRKALQNRQKIQAEIESVSAVRDALKVMENDINRAFNHRDVNIQLYNETAKERNKKIDEAKGKSGQPVQPTTPPPSPPTTPPPAPAGADPYASMEPMKLKEEKILTHFMGEQEGLNFSSLSNARISSEERTSDQAEIGYRLKECRSRADRKRSTRCLFRRVATLIDDDILLGGEETPLVEDVQKLEFRYLGAVSPTEWVANWYTNERGDDRTKNVFPFAVEVTIEVQNKEDKASKPVRMTMVAGIRNPNNPPPKPQVGPDGKPIEGGTIK